jgi:hypothetical protein
MKVAHSVSKLIFASLILANGACQSQVQRPASPDRVSKDVYFLASDENEGRGIGTRGLDNAADYIAARFRSLGLRELPGCTDYFQPFAMNASLSVDPASSLSAGDTHFELSRQFRPLGFSPDGAFSGPVVFVGYGISSTKDHYDDYAGIDVTGKVVLMFRFEPHNETGKSRFTGGDWSGNASFNSKAESALVHHAAAVLLVNPPKYHGPDRLMPVSRAGGSSKVPFMQITQRVADGMLKQAGAKDLASLQNEIDTTGSPQSFELKGPHVSGNAQLLRKRVPVKNVLAYLPGGRHPDEYVVVGAHYDHLGHGGAGSLAPGDDEIHNGADDNASGTAAVLSLAEKFVYAGRRDRSILFILFTGEEEGLVGSEYFVNHPPVPLDKMVAMLNLDMVGRVRNETLYYGGSGTADALDGILAAADARSPLQLKSIGKSGRGPSDHQSFSMKKIPVLFFFSGMHADYHRPTDDADKVNYPGEAEVVDLSFDVIDALSKMPRQQYVSKFDSETLTIDSTGPTSRSGPRASLGVVPDYGTDESTVGVRITGTTPGSPADSAGLREGDTIVQIDQKKIDNLYDLTDFLNSAKPGDHVNITVMRDKQRVQMQTTLSQRGGSN